ncbi:hypothetical protein ScPMuIL_018707 [Solemya velum]
MDHVEITVDKLNVERIQSSVASPKCGAISLFIGTTRDHFDGKEVVQLEYEAYRPMAEKKMKEICQQIRDKWPVENISVVHRVGVVPVCEASIVIALSSPHRKEAMEAVQFAIDTLKATVPIWKKELYGDGTSSWKENKECCWKSDHT